MSEDKNIGFPRLRPLLYKAGLPEEMHDEFVDGIASFTTMMTVLIEANDDVAKNYITFAMVVPTTGQMYELTIKKSDGKTPVELIDELTETLNLAKKMVHDWLGEDENGKATEDISTTAQLVTGLRELLEI